MKTIKDIKIIDLTSYIEDGVLVPIEFKKDIPFEVNRLFYVFGVPSEQPRGQHAHYKTKQILTCLNGTIECICKDGFGGKINFQLNDPTKGVYIPEMIWDEQVYKSNQSFLLSICSTSYDPNDYINDYEEFKKLKKETINASVI